MCTPKQHLENKKTKAERRLEEVGEILSDLQGLYRGEAKPVIKFFEGREGIRNIYWHTLETKSVIYSILDLNVYLPEFWQMGKDYVRERARRNVKEKLSYSKIQPDLNFTIRFIKIIKIIVKLRNIAGWKDSSPFRPRLK